MLFFKAVNPIVNVSIAGIKPELKKIVLESEFDWLCVFFRVTQEKTVKQQDRPGP